MLWPQNQTRVTVAYFHKCGNRNILLSHNRPLFAQPEDARATELGDLHVDNDVNLFAAIVEFVAFNHGVGVLAHAADVAAGAEESLGPGVLIMSLSKARFDLRLDNEAPCVMCRAMVDEFAVLPAQTFPSEIPRA